MKKVTLLVLFVLISALIIISDIQAANFETYLKTSYLDWTEKTSLSKRDPFVREFGPVFSVGGNVSFRHTEKFFSRSELEIFGGLINYQGEHLTNMSPYNTSSWRLGVKLEETIGYKIKISQDFTLFSFSYPQPNLLDSHKNCII